MLKASRDKDDPNLTAKLDGLTDEPARRLLSRLMTWAGIALLMASAAIIAARTETGSQRIARLFAPTPPAPLAQRTEPARQAADPMLVYETRRLADQLRVMAAEREALIDRLAAVERTVGDVTASISRPEAAQPRPVRVIEAPPPAPVATPAAPQPIPQTPAATAAAPPSPAPSVQAAPPSGSAPTTAPVPTPPPAQQAAAAPPDAQESATMRTEFGVDIAGEATMEALRTRWQQFRNQHGPIMEGLRPVVAVQEGRQGAVELRLVVGPLSNANAATRLCATLSSAGVNCKPAVFDGQRLAVR